jgi:hypothetical protein
MNELPARDLAIVIVIAPIKRLRALALVTLLHLRLLLRLPVHDIHESEAVVRNRLYRPTFAGKQQHIFKAYCACSVARS